MIVSKDSFMQNDQNSEDIKKIIHKDIWNIQNLFSLLGLRALTLQPSKGVFR
jgi:hypothetical protein